MKHIKSYKLFESVDPYLELKNIIFTNCQPFIDLSKSCKSPLKLWRGVSENFIRKNGKRVGELVYEVKHQMDRKPTDTPLSLHNRLNNEFENKFGWPVRNGVFCTTDKGLALSYASLSSGRDAHFDYLGGESVVEFVNYYSEAYFFIPIGNFKYCWSPKYHDLISDIKLKKGLSSLDIKKELENLSNTRIKNIVNSYKDSDISDSIFNTLNKKDACEISFYCDKYLLISQRYFVNKDADFWNW